LANSAKKAGYKIGVIDAFLDEETVLLSSLAFKATYTHQFGFDIVELEKLIKQKFLNSIVVVGSGFEINPEQINHISKYAPVLSNSTEIINTVKHPKSLEKLLNEEFIRYPFTTFQRNECGDNKTFLLKEIGAMGGGHVQRKSRLSNIQPLVNKNFYYQEFIKGNVFSAVFLANGDRATLIGLNQHLKSNQFSDQPFLYEGAISIISKNQKDVDKVNAIINKITKKISLVGLCGIDFIIDEYGVIFVIDVNPRPPSTFELHESEQSLFPAHLACFQGDLIHYLSDNDKCSRGHVIYYAKEDTIIYEELNWPEWVKDRPSSRQTISVKNPICSIFAEGDSETQVENILYKRLEEIELFVKSI